MIPTAAYPHPIVAAALDRARAVVDAWVARGWELREVGVHMPTDTNGARAWMSVTPDCIVSGWTAVALIEAIAREILLAQGFDIDALADALSDAPRQCVADVLAAWPRRICSPPGNAARTAFDRDIYDCTCGHMLGEHDSADGSCSRCAEEGR